MSLLDDPDSSDSEHQEEVSKFAKPYLRDFYTQADGKASHIKHLFNRLAGKEFPATSFFELMGLKEYDDEKIVNFNVVMDAFQRCVQDDDTAERLINIIQEETKKLRSA